MSLFTEYLLDFYLICKVLGAGGIVAESFVRWVKRKNYAKA